MRSILGLASLLFAFPLRVGDRPRIKSKGRYIRMKQKFKAIFNISRTTLLAGTLLILGGATAANADTVDFNFSTVTYSASATNTTSTGLGAAASAIQTYMDSALASAGCSSCSVTVHGG